MAEAALPNILVVRGGSSAPPRGDERARTWFRALVRRSVVSSCAWCGLLAILLVPSASAQGTALSTFSKTGTDRATGSVASAGGPAGTTAAGDTIDWVLSYRNTTAGLAQATITDPIVGNQTFVPGSLRAPPGMTLQWSTDGGASYVSTEPASGVNAIAAGGPQAPNSTGTQLPASDPPSGFAPGRGSGDGFEALFIGPNIYNVHHHRTAGTATRTIDCHVKTTGAQCPGYPATYVSATAGAPLGTGGDALDTANQPFAAVDRAGGRIYFPAGVHESTSIGVACVDVINYTSCGYTKLADAPVVNSGGQLTQITGGAQIGTRYYLQGTAAGAPIYCFDYATGAACPGYPISSHPGFPANAAASAALYSDVQAFDGRYVFGNITAALGPNTPRTLTCVDTTTNTLCPGFPKVAYGGVVAPSGATGVYNSMLAPILDAAGNVTGICGETATNATSAPFACFSLAGAAVGAAPWGQLVPGAQVNLVAFGGVLHIGPKLYFAYTVNATGQATYACWDFSTGATCSGFVQASSGSNVAAYTLRQDPDNPDCIWEIGDSGVFEVLSATFGGVTCNAGSASVSVTPEAFYCDGGSGHVTGWNQVVLGGVTSADYDGLAVTITDANGNVVPGWNNRVFPNSQQTIDVSTIPYSGANTTLRAAVSISWGAHPVRPATWTATFTGDPVQVCFSTRVGAAQCATAQSITNSANAVTSAGGGVSDAPGGNGSGTATFTLAPDPAECRASLSLAKIAATDPVVAGSDETYTLAVTNNGPDTANDVVVSDSLPAGLTFVAASAGCTHSGGVVTCNAGSLANGASATFEIVAHVAASVTDPITNQARAHTSTCCGPDPTAEVTVEVTRDARLAITKRPSASRLPPGGQVMYTIVVENGGPSDAHDVSVSDTPPAGLSVASAEPSQGTCAGTAPVSCSLGTLVAGGSAQIVITANIAATAVGSIANSATASCPSCGPPVTADALIVVTSPQPSAPQPTADLQVAKRINRASAPAGQRLTYTIEVRNNGPDAAANVRVTDTSALPLRVTSITTSQGSCTPAAPFDCELGTIAPSQTVTITVRATPKRLGTEINAASATSEARDPNADNNLSSAKTRIYGRLRLIKTANDQVAAGRNVTYRLKVTNPTQIAVRRVQVCDQLPPALEFVKASPKPRLRNGRYCWTIKKLGAKRSRTYRLTVRTLAGASGRVVNRATAEAPTVRRRLKARHAVTVYPVPRTRVRCSNANSTGKTRRKALRSRVCSSMTRPYRLRRHLDLARAQRRAARRGT